MKLSKKTIALFIVFCFFISTITPLVDFTKLDFRIKNVKASTNYLFKDTVYNMTLEDVYDDADAYKVYTDSYFQSQYFNSSYEWQQIHNETVDSGTDNNEIQLGDPSHITMIQGITGSEDEMDILDTVCTIFDSTTNSGYYPGTYSFDDDDVDSEPDNWTSNNGIACSTIVIAGIDGHTKVLICHDGYYTSIFSITNIFSSAQTNGTFEAWVRTTDISKLQRFTFYDGANFRFQVGIYNNQFFTYQPGVGYTYFDTAVNNQWHHLRIDFECGAGGYQGLGADKIYVYVDGTRYGAFNFQSVSTSIDRVTICSDTTPSGYYFYVDAIGYNWDPAYDIGDNIIGSTSDLEFSILTPFIKYNRDLLSVHVESHQKTNISQQIYFKIWNYDSSSYETITSATETTSITERDFNSASPEDYITSSGVKLYWTGENSGANFLFSIDYLFIRITYKMNIWHEVSFDTNGIWRYRWEIHGSLSYTSWTNFEVVDPEPNFHAISESDVSTRWILQGADISPVEDFSDDLSGSNWDLSGVSERFFDKNTIQSANYLLDNSSTSSTWAYSDINFYTGSQNSYPRGITWDGTYFWVLGDYSERVYKYTSAGVYTGISFSVEGTYSTLEGICWDGTYFWVLGVEEGIVVKFTSAGVFTGTYFWVISQCPEPTGITWDGTYFYVVDYDYKAVYKYTSAGSYTGTHWDVSAQENQPTGICWDGTYFWVTGDQKDSVYQYNSAGSYTGIHFYVGTEDNHPEGITWDGTYLWIVGNQHGEVYKYEYLTTISKNYLGSGYMYMQTSTTETIVLKSTDYGSHYSLASGDYFTVDFQTSSDSQINLILYKDGNIQKTLTLSQSGNTNFNRHTVQISVPDDVEFDQLKISSTFEDTDYCRVYDIRTMKYTLTGDHEDFYISSHNQRDVYLTPDIYNLRIFEEGAERINTNITISTTDYYYVYTPTATQSCRLTLFSEEGDYLNFEDYHIQINRSLNGEYNQFWLLDNIFYIDVGTYVYIDVYDRFNALIGSFERLAASYIDLELEVYQLQIKNLMETQTTVDINSTHVYPLLSEELLNFMLAEDWYQIGYYDSNDVYKQFLIKLDSNQAYELNRSKICFLAFVNQRGEHLSFNNYKTYINGTLLYENIFYKEIGDKIGIEVKDLFDISIKNQTYTVVSGDNYIPVVLTLYSLKVMNQQEQFNHINITRDPNYYESEYYWSEWIAPNEIIKFNLFTGYYKINLTDNENGAYSYYSYTLSGDDILLISSDNVISQVIYNIENVNVTLGNQITNVEINITNQNSAINQSIINVVINLENINSTLGDMLVSLSVDIENINNNLNSLYVFTNNSFINLNTNMNNSFIYMENNILMVNQSISNLVVGVQNDLLLINGTITTMITNLGTDLLLMNTSIHTFLYALDVNLTAIGSNIDQYYIFLNNSINLVDSNINDSRIAIINNLALVNSTLASLIADVYTSVYLINNTIYSAVVDLGTYLALVNNSISGNLSIVLKQNDFLTELYKMTMFSELLNWTNVGLNTSLLTSQIDAWSFINNFKNESITVFLRYQDKIENLTISAQNALKQFLPNDDVEYRLWSESQQKYLSKWEELPENRTVDFGFYEAEVPYNPTPIVMTFLNYLWVLIFIMVLACVMIFLYAKIKKAEPSGFKKRKKGRKKPTTYEKNFTFSE